MPSIPKYRIEVQTADTGWQVAALADDERVANTEWNLWIEHTQGQCKVWITLISGNQSWEIIKKYTPDSERH